MGPEKTADTTSYSRGLLRPSHAKTLSLSIIEGAGKAGWPLHPGPPRKRNLRERVDHRYRRDQPGLPCAVVYSLYRALLGEPLLECHRRCCAAFGAIAT